MSHDRGDFFSILLRVLCSLDMGWMHQRNPRSEAGQKGMLQRVNAQQRAIDKKEKDAAS